MLTKIIQNPNIVKKNTYIQWSPECQPPPPLPHPTAIN